MPSTAPTSQAAASPEEDKPSLTAPASVPAENTYGQILKSSALIGASSVFNVGVGIVRTKIMAVLLGPAGYGLIGLYSSIISLAQNIACMGIDNSGVRQIAAAVGSGDIRVIGRTAIVLRRASVALGMLGGLLLLVFSAPISRLTFDSDERTFAVALLSLAVLFRVVSEGQRALIRGLRRISELVRSRMTGEFLGAVASVVLIYFWREQGIVPALIAIEAMALLLSWRFSRKAWSEMPSLSASRPSLSASQVAQEAGALLRLGFAFMVSGMLMNGAAYAVRMIVVRGPLPIRVDTRRVLCRLHLAGHGSRLLPSSDCRHREPRGKQPLGERAGSGQPPVGGTWGTGHPDVRACGHSALLFGRIPASR